MLRDSRALERLSVHATDGDIGHVRDIYFDDERWVMRYLVVETGGWLIGRDVLISPIAITEVDWDARRVHVNLTRQKVEDSPGIESHRPVSRQGEAALFRHYGYPYYWSGPYAWGYAVLPVLAEQQSYDDPQRLEIRKEMEEASKGDQHLRSCNEVAGYKVAARDAKLGHVVDFLFDESDWSIQYLIIDPHDFWPGKHVTVGTDHIQQVFWDDKEVITDLESRDIESGPIYDPEYPPPSRAAQSVPRAGNAPPVDVH